MAALSPEIETFSAAVGAIYAAAWEPSLWTSALGAIARCSDDVGAIFIYPRSDGGYGAIVTPGLEAVERDFQSSTWRAQDLRFTRALERGYIESGECVTDRHLVSDEEVDTHPYYAELLRSHGLKWFAGLNISPAPHLAAAVSVQRALDRPAFSDEELALVALLGRHVESAMRLGLKLLRADAAGPEERAQLFSASLKGEGPADPAARLARVLEQAGVPPATELGGMLTRLAAG